MHAISKSDLLRTRFNLDITSIMAMVTVLLMLVFHIRHPDSLACFLHASAALTRSSASLAHSTLDIEMEGFDDEPPPAQLERKVVIAGHQPAAQDAVTVRRRREAMEGGKGEHMEQAVVGRERPRAVRRIAEALQRNSGVGDVE